MFPQNVRNVSKKKIAVIERKKVVIFAKAENDMVFNKRC